MNGSFWVFGHANISNAILWNPGASIRPRLRPVCAAAKAVAQREFLHLAARRHRQRVDEHQVFGKLVFRHAVRFEVFHQFRQDRPPLARHDERAAFLAEPRIGHPDHGHLPDRGMLQQKLLDLARADFQATAVDDVLLAPDDSDVAVAVHGREVVAEQPALGRKRFARAHGIGEVAEGDVGAARRQFALLAWPEPARACLVEDREFRARHGFAVAAPELVFRVGGRRGAADEAFGHAPHADQQAAEPLARGAAQRLRYGRAGAGEIAQAARVVSRRRRFHQHRRERRRRQRIGAAFGLDQP